MPISLIIAGSRTVDPSVSDIDAELFKIDIGWGEFPRDVGSFKQIVREVIDGGARGADRAGRRWAEERGIPVHSEPVTRQDIQQHGAYLGPKMRNRRMAERGDIAVVFWDAESGGTADLVTRMVVRRKFVEVVPTRKSKRSRARQPPVSAADATPICCDRFVHGDGVHEAGCRRHG